MSCVTWNKCSSIMVATGLIAVVSKYLSEIMFCEISEWYVVRWNIEIIFLSVCFCDNFLMVKGKSNNFSEISSIYTKFSMIYIQYMS